MALVGIILRQKQENMGYGNRKVKVVQCLRSVVSFWKTEKRVGKQVLYPVCSACQGPRPLIYVSRLRRIAWRVAPEASCGKQHGFTKFSFSVRKITRRKEKGTYLDLTAHLNHLLCQLQCRFYPLVAWILQFFLELHACSIFLLEIASVDTVCRRFLSVRFQTHRCR